MNQQTTSPIWAWPLLLLLAIIWGSSFIMMKLAMFDASGDDLYSGEQVAALRMTIAGLVLLPFAIRYRKSLFGPKWKYFLIVGLFGNTIPAFLFTAAQNQDNSAFIGVLNSLTPLFTLLIGVAAFKLKVRWFNTVGIAIALIGAALLIWFQNSSSTQGSFTDALLVIGATLCYAISVNVIKTFLSDEHPIKITTVAFTYVLPFTLAFLLSTNFIEILSTNPEGAKGFYYVLVLAVVGTTIAVILFNRLVAKTTPVFAASVTYLIPIVALFWGWYFNEPINWTLASICSITILIGVYLVNRK